MQFGKLFTSKIQSHRKKIHENMFEDFHNCNKYSAFFLMKIILFMSKSMHFEKLSDLCFLCEAAELKIKGRNQV